DLLEGAASANVGDGFVDVGVGRLRLVLEKRRDGHDHAALAVAALRNVVIDPGLLHPMHGAGRGQALDSGDLLALSRADGKRAGTDRLAVDVDGAGAALRDAAAILGAGQADLLADRPQQRGIRLHVDIMCLSVDSQASHYVLLLAVAHPRRVASIGYAG